jgi:hypothetical protein
MSKQVKKVPVKVAAKTPATKTPAKDAQIIKVLVTENPKRGESRTRFARYKTGMKVEDYVARTVKAGKPSSLARADLRWDTERKYIAIQ